jgi:choline dehydrogenase-like flavoprotein
MGIIGDSIGGFDTIVVGGGAAGSLVAGRLAATTDMKVLLLESGGRDTNPLIHIPGGFAKLLAYGQFIYPYATIPQIHLNGREIPLEQGCGLGGGSSVNAMIYVRGQAADYEAWDAATGGTGLWSYETMLAHFRSMEGNDIFSAPFHGHEGPLRVSQPEAIDMLNQATMRAFQEYGLPYNPDYNGATQTGVGPCQLTIGDNHRCSSATAFLHPAENLPNLTVRTGAQVQRLILDGDRVAGIEFAIGGDLQYAEADQVVVSAGAINTPRLLMLSGIGPEKQLRQHGIDVLVKADEVGANLQDHPQSAVLARVNGNFGYARYASGLGMVMAGARYFMDHTGPAATNGSATMSFFNPDDPTGNPTIQSFHLPVSHSGLAALDPHPGITITSTLIQPRSRVSVGLRDADPSSMPLIDPNYLSHPEDMRRLIGGLRYVRDVMEQPSLRGLIEADVLPGRTLQSDAELAAYVRETATTVWHPVGTCRMGSDEASVVDPSLRVRGVRGLRIIDSSIMPNITSGNTNGPTMALASRGLGLFLKDIGIEPSVSAGARAAPVDVPSNLDVVT